MVHARMYDGHLNRRAFPTGNFSRKRLAVARAVLESSGTFTVNELVTAARERVPGIATATVYRAVAAMVESGFVVEVGNADGATLYARCAGGEHHHHGICERCGDVVRLRCPIPDPHLQGSPGFRVTRHELRVWGVCATCGQRDGAAT